MSAADGLRKRTDAMAQMLIRNQEAEGARHFACWEGGGYRAFVAYEPYGEGDYRWHVSVSREDRQIPTWDDVASIVHRLRPGVPMVVGIPPRSQWMSVPGTEVLHAIQVRDENLTERWKHEATMTREEG